MTAEPQPLTPDAIQSADASLNAYLEARAADFNAHGWKDADGLIESRGGYALLAPHIGITLRRARTAERERNARIIEAAGLRSLLEDVATTVAQCREIGRPYGGDPLWSTVIARCDAILARVAAVTPETVAETAQPDAGRPTEAPPQPEPSNSSSPPQGAAQAVPTPEHLPGHPGKFAAPPTGLETEPTPRQPSPGHITAYKLDHCGSCRDAEFYGWSGLMMERAHARHLGTIDVGPLAGQPCRCKRCTEPAGSGTPDA